MLPTPSGQGVAVLLQQIAVELSDDDDDGDGGGGGGGGDDDDNESIAPSQPPSIPSSSPVVAGPFAVFTVA